jgi:hypothetical protein
MMARFSSSEELDLDVPGPVGGKYVGKLRREGFVKILKLVWEVPDDIILRGLGL